MPRPDKAPDKTQGAPQHLAFGSPYTDGPPGRMYSFSAKSVPQHVAGADHHDIISAVGDATPAIERLGISILFRIGLVCGFHVK